MLYLHELLKGLADIHPVTVTLKVPAQIAAGLIVFKRQYNITFYRNIVRNVFFK